MGFAYTDNRVDTFTFPYVTTLFSAANYCGSHGNKAALLVFYEDDIQVYKFVNCVAMVLPYMVFTPPFRLSRSPRPMR